MKNLLRTSWCGFTFSYCLRSHIAFIFCVPLSVLKSLARWLFSVKPEVNSQELYSSSAMDFYPPERWILTSTSSEPFRGLLPRNHHVLDPTQNWLPSLLPYSIYVSQWRDQLEVWNPSFYCQWAGLSLRCKTRNSASLLFVWFNQFCSFSAHAQIFKLVQSSSEVTWPFPATLGCPLKSFCRHFTIVIEWCL